MKKVSILYSAIQEVKKQISLANLIQKLPSDLQKENLLYLREQDRFSHAISRLLLAKLLYKFTKKNSSYLSKIKYNSYQKPYFDLNFHFNISHSGDFVLCAASDSIHVGIDIEEKREIAISDFEDLFTDLEWDNISKDKTLTTFFDYWSKKESIIKTDGRGLGIDLKSIIIEKNNATLENQNYYLVPLTIHQNYSAHLCSQNSKIEVEISNFDIFS